MGLLEALLGRDNPAAMWANDNSNLLGALGAGLAGGQNIQDGLAQGLSYAPQAKALDRQAVEKRKADALIADQKNATVDWLKQNQPDLAGMVAAGMPVSEAWSEAMRRMQPQGTGASLPASIQEYQFYADQSQAAGQQPVSYDEWRRGSNQTVRAGLGQPISLKNRQTGEYHPFQPMSDGSMVDTLTGQPANANDWVYDPMSVAGDRAFATSAGTTAGKDTTQAALDLPTVVDRGQQSIALIDQLLPEVRDPQTGQMVKNQGFDEQFGMAGPIPIGQMTPALPRTAKANFQASLDQVKAQGFLQGIQQMQGTGAISEAEGSKATQAIINASTATTPEAFVQNMNIAKQIIQAGIERAKAKASQSPYSVPYAGGGNTTSTGVSWSVEP